MRVLLIHNRYRQPGGEERAVDDLAALLERHGHTVEVLQRSSAGAGARRAAAGLLSGGLDEDQVESAARRLGADVVHAHNVHPLFGWRALAAGRRAGARTVLHLHNFRLFCAIAVCHRDRAPCFRCHDGYTLPGLRLRCRGSVGEAAVYAAGLSLQWRRLLASADRVVAVSAATAARLQDLGLRWRAPAVLHNFVAVDRLAGASAAGRGTHALVAGRLVEEKGYDTAVAAAGAAGVPLVIAGAGPDEPRLRALAAGADVRFTGHLEAARLAELRARAAVVLAPSRWEEPCPYAVLDAMAAGVPVLAADRGGLPELLGPERVLPAADGAAWVSALRRLWESPELRQEEGERALRTARERFGERSYLERLMEIYTG